MKDKIIITTFVFFIGTFVGGYLFSETKYLPETVASEKCRELGGIFRVQYKEGLVGKDGSVFYKDDPIFHCFTTEKELFKY